MRSSLSVVVIAFALAGSVGVAAAQYYPPPPPGYPPPYAQPGYAAPPLPPPGAIYDPRDDENDAVGGPYVPYPPPPAARVYPGSYSELPPQPAPTVEGFQRPPADVANGPGSDDVTGTVRAPSGLVSPPAMKRGR